MSDDNHTPTEDYSGMSQADIDAMEQTLFEVKDASGDALPLQKNDNGKIIPNLFNAVTILEQGPRYRKQIWYDEFLDRIMTGNPARQWSDADDLALTMYYQQACGITSAPITLATSAAQSVAFRNPRNCVRDWIDRQKWDSVPRLDSFFEDCFGAERTAYTIAVGRNFWLSLVARIYKPGCQVDNMIVLEGKQGIGKSRVLRIIGGEHYTDQHESATNAKAFAEILQGKMVVEIAEMDSFSRSEVTRVKAIVTTVSDRYRAAYGRHAIDHPRQCIFAGTTNTDDWNKDATGARRFWPIRCAEINTESVALHRSQYFAEAAVLFRSGETWWEMPSEETTEQQRARFDADPWVEEISVFISSLTSVTVNEILKDCIKLKISDITRSEQMRVASSLRFFGWSSKRERRGIDNIRVWKPQ